MTDIAATDEPTHGGPLIDHNPTAAARALLVGVALLMAGNGLQGSLIGVRSEAEGFSLTATGIVMACYFAGFLVGAKWSEELLPRVGHIRVFAALASSASAAVLLHALFVSPLSWGSMRFVSGMCMAGLYVVIESWLHDMATSATRGRLLSMYMVASMGGLTIGQLLLDAADQDSLELFIVASILVSLSLLPVTLSASTSPPVVVPESLSFRALVREVPTGVLGSFLVGTSAGVILGIGAVYAVAAGIESSRVAVFLAAPLLGSIVLQWPIGWVSDRVSRRLVMWWVAVAATVVAGALVMVTPGSWSAIVLMFLLGGTVFPLYSLTLAYTGDWLAPGQLTAASAVLVRVNGIGAVCGPLLAAPLMAWLGPTMFFWVLAGANATFVVYVAWRVVFRDALPMGRQRVFVAFPARASAVAAGLIGRRDRSVYAREAGPDGLSPGTPTEPVARRRPRVPSAARRRSR